MMLSDTVRRYADLIEEAFEEGLFRDYLEDLLCNLIIEVTNESSD